ncbi:N-terminal acetyltransferase B complex catalytic subunit NAA20 isoform X1 [Typha latifolia]|uniref:N-terminal acetyltransferase B complex catalytic subunit NAA20 isoform X1 n=1 Tax=Typha latifolia TaxID=4733 RepID=UPI003C2D73F6
MATIRRFGCDDLLRFASVNLDHLTETFNMSFYMTYLARWPDYFHVAESPGNRIMGYIMGKVEGQGESWHGHVTAVTVAPEYRRQKLANKLMNLLEEISDKMDKAYFVDLFVRASNMPAIKMYEKVCFLPTLLINLQLFSLLVYICLMMRCSDQYAVTDLGIMIVPWVFGSTLDIFLIHIEDGCKSTA